MKRLRIAYLRIAQETNALSRLDTTMDDFRSVHFFEGAQLGEACSKKGVEAPGFMKNAELSGLVAAAVNDGAVDTIPLFSAWAVPSGPLSLECFTSLRDRLVADLRTAGPIDGLFFCLHGAMGARGIRDPESRLLEAAREVLGPSTPIAVTHDLHANLTRDRVALSTVLVSYRTNPHRDHFGTGRRAASLLFRAARGEIKPVMAWRTLPMLLGGGNTIDVLAPMRGIFRAARRLEGKKVLSASVNMCHPWSDDPDLGWSTLVITDGDAELASSGADALAVRCWEVREQLPPHFPAPEEAIAAARQASIARRLGVVVMSDASDVVSAGSAGENTALLRALLAATDLRSLVPLRAPAVVAALADRAVGETVTVTVGGALDPAWSEPLEVTGVIRHSARHTGFERVVVLDLGHLSLVLTEGPALVLKPSFYTQAGLSPWRSDVVVVKNFFPFRLFFLPLARKTIYVKTRGLTDFDAAFGLRFTDAMHPRDRVTDWRPADERRRGIR